MSFRDFNDGPGNIRVKKIVKIRTGGQTGVDRAAMDFAREHEIPLCGWCPKNGWAEDYTVAPGLLKDYPELTETFRRNRTTDKMEYA